MLTPKQLRATRALVGYSREDLAERSGVAAVTSKGFELLGANLFQNLLPEQIAARP
jgi:hypothetical protein